MTALLLLIATQLPAQGAESPGLVQARQDPPDPVWVERQVLAMGTRLQGRVVAASRDEGLRILEAVYQAVDEVEGLLSTWRSDTDLARLNRGAVGQARAVAPELLALLDEALEWSRVTGGAFDPRMGALVDAWDLRGEGRRPSGEELEAAMAASGPGAVELDRARGTLARLRQEAWVDPGGFGKGAALRRAREVLRSGGADHAVLDFGGQILVLGGGADGLEVPVAHPSRREAPAALLRVADRSVATSGASERFVTVQGEALGHVLDPRTGTPVPAWGSVTVVAEDPVAADVLATALFVLGPEEALRWAREHGEYGVLVLEDGPRGLQARWNEAMKPYLAGTAESGTGRRAIDTNENHGG